MAFPVDPIEARVELALGANPGDDPSTWSWTDVTEWVRHSGGITIGRGRSDEFATITPARCSLTVDNTGGRWVARNARGPWYGQIRKGTPLRVSVNPGDDWYVRFSGFIDALPPRMDVTGRNQYVPLTASGLLKRLSRPKAPLRSAAYRQGATLLAGRAYLPLEDGPDAQRAAAGLPGQPDAPPFGGTGAPTGGTGMPRWGAVDGPPGSARLPDFSDRRGLTGLITNWGDDDGQWSVSCWIQGATTSGATSCSPIQWRTDGSVGYWAILARWPGDGSGTQTPVGQLRIWVLAMTEPGENWALEDIDNEVLIGSADHDWHHVRVVATDSAGDINVALYVDGVLRGTTTADDHTIGRPVGYHINPTTQTAAYLDVDGIGLTSIGHVMFETIGSGGAMYSAGRGWPGELAGSRIEAILDEEGVAHASIPSGTQEMGPQPIDTLLGIVRECEATDAGLVFEARTGELDSVPGEDRYNRTVDLTLNWEDGQVGQPFEPVDDDQQLRNSVVASRRAGGSASYTDDEHVEMYGLYQDSVTVNPAADLRLRDHAAWRVRQGTIDDLRVPVLSLDLAHPSQTPLIPDWLACDIGSRVQVTNPPSDLMVDTLDLIVEGYTETIQTPRTWDVSMNCSPASPWTVGVVEDPVFGRPDTDGSVLVDAITGLTSSGVLISDDFEVATDGWTANSGGTVTRSTVQAHEGDASLLFTPDGVTALSEARSANAPGVVAGRVYRAAAWVRCVVARSVNINIVWRDVNGSFLSNAGSASVVVAAHTWTPIEIVGTAPASAVQGQISVSMGSTPSAGQLLYVDDVTLKMVVRAQVMVTDGPLWINSTDHTTMFPFNVRSSGVVLEVTGITAPASPTHQAGTAAHGSNAGVSPTLPASIQDGDLLILLAAIRNSGSGVPVAPSGWTRLPVFGTGDNVQLFGRIASGTVSAPFVTFSGSVSGATTSARIVRFRGGLYDPANVERIVVASSAQLTESAQDIAYPALRVRHPHCLILYVGWKQDDWTSVATISGATEVMDDPTTSGDDQGIVMDLVIQGATEATIAAGAFSVTGGAAAISRGAVVAIRDNRQVFTVNATPVNGVVKTIPADEPLSLASPWRAAL